LYSLGPQVHDLVANLNDIRKANVLKSLGDAESCGCGY